MYQNSNKFKKFLINIQKVTKKVLKKCKKLKQVPKVQYTKGKNSTYRLLKLTCHQKYNFTKNKISSKQICYKN